MSPIKRHQIKKIILVSLVFASSVHSDDDSNTTDTAETNAFNKLFNTTELSSVDEINSSTPKTIKSTSADTTYNPEITFELPENSTFDYSFLPDSDIDKSNSFNKSIEPDSAKNIDFYTENSEVLPDRQLKTYSAGMFVVLHSPHSIKFLKSQETVETLLPQIYLACLGLSVNEKTKWDGLHIEDPFDMPRAVVQISIDGTHLIEDADDLQDKDDIKVYPLTMVTYEPNIFEEVKKRVKNTYTDSNLYNTRLSDSKALSAMLGGPIDLTRRLNLEVLQHLNMNVKVDMDFIEELAHLGLLSFKVYNGFIVPSRTMVDFYDFKFMSMHPLVDHHGPDSPAAIEARSLLLEAVKALREAFVKTYSEAVVVTAVTSEISHDLRASRETFSSGLREGREMKSPAYSPDFPVIFNIVFWLLIIIGLSMVAICQAFMQMAADTKPILIIAPKKRDDKMEAL